MRRITSLHLLAILFLMQPSILFAAFAAEVHCWLIFYSMSTKTSAAFHLFWHGAGLCTFPTELLKGPVSPYLQPDEVSLGDSTTLECVCHSSQQFPLSSANLLRVYSAPSSRSLIKTSNSIGHHIDP